MKKLVTFIAVMATAFSALAFNKAQTPEQIKAEVARIMPLACTIQRSDIFYAP